MLPALEYNQDNYGRGKDSAILPREEWMSNGPMESVARGGTSPKEKVRDDRENIAPGDEVVMIVEDDPNFAFLMLDVAREKGFKALVVPLGNNVLSLAREYQPQAITLDLHLPDTDGWSVLARLKEDAATRHIPVHIISVDEERDRGLRQAQDGLLCRSPT